MQQTSGLENRHIDVYTYQDLASSDSVKILSYNNVFQPNNNLKQHYTVVAFPGKKEIPSMAIDPRQSNFFDPGIWLPLILFGAFAAMALLKMLLRNPFESLLIMGVAPKGLSESERRQIDKNQLLVTLLAFVSCILIAVILYSLRIRNWEFSNVPFLSKIPRVSPQILDFIWALVAILGFFIIKSGVFYLLGKTFNVVKKMQEYGKTYRVFWASSSIILVVVAGLILFLQQNLSAICLTISSLTVVYGIAMFVFRVFGAHSNILLFRNLKDVHIFLYLCTLEILPLIIISKVIQQLVT